MLSTWTICRSRSPRGRKERRVRFGIESRKVLFRFTQFKERARVRSDLMFLTREGGRWEQRNTRRSYYSPQVFQTTVIGNET
jgi:site-specific recombinase XerC